VATNGSIVRSAQIPKDFRALFERDEQAHAAHGLPLREDVQNARRIVSEGPGGFKRLKAARLRGDRIYWPAGVQQTAFENESGYWRRQG
jgi:hypothetical protein